MDHQQAIEQKAAERYLLDELAPDAREAFEEHFFDCPECAFDMRAGVAFVDEAKVQLPDLNKPLPFPSRSEAGRTQKKTGGWLEWWRPVFVAPAFAALLLVVGYQNLVTLPGLRATLDRPQIAPVAALHGATRGATPTVVMASRKTGLALPLELGGTPGATPVRSYALDLYDADQKLAWSGISAVPEGGDGTVSLNLPGPMLKNGVYKVVVSAVGPNGERTPVETDVFDVRLAE